MEPVVYQADMLAALDDISKALIGASNAREARLLVQQAKIMVRRGDSWPGHRTTVRNIMHDYD